MSKEIAVIDIPEEVFISYSKLIKIYENEDITRFHTMMATGREMNKLKKLKCWFSEQSLIDDAVSNLHKSPDYIRKSMRIAPVMDAIIVLRPDLMKYGISKLFHNIQYLENLEIKECIKEIEMTHPLSTSCTKEYFREKEGGKGEVHTCEKWKTIEKEVCESCGKEKPKPKEAGKGIRYSMAGEGKKS